MLKDNQLLIVDSNPLLLKRELLKYSPKRIFLVTGKLSYKNSGSEDYINEALDSYDYLRFSNFESNPKFEDVKKGIDLFNNSKSDLIIAIGGGSAIDMAKLICSLSNTKESNHLDVIIGKIDSEKRKHPLIAIPTTSGTGSEATHFAVVYVKNKKYSLANSSLIPDIVVLNVDLLKSQNSYLRACTGLDALSQAIESFWAIGSTIESKGYAKEAIILLIENLKKSINNNDEKTISKVAYASFLAGKAINISKTTAPHAISYSITTLFKIPHGHAVFMTLPQILKYNYDTNDSNCNDKRGSLYVKKNMMELFKILDTKTVTQAFEKLRNLAHDMGVELSFDKNGITDTNIDKILDNINLERMKNNPRLIELDSLKQILIQE